MSELKAIVDETSLEPRFEPRTSVSYPSMVIDVHGKAWWVDPNKKTIERARACTA